MKLFLKFSCVHNMIKMEDMEMKKVCIFDMDGTLLDTLESLYVSVNLTLKELNLGEITKMQVRAFVGNGARYLIEKSILAASSEVETICSDKKIMITEESICDEEILNQGMNIYKRVFAEHCMYKVEPYDGIREVLDSLKEQGVQLGILSNKPHARTVEIAEEIFGIGYFDYIQGQSDTLPRKPDPESLRYVMRELGVNKEACAYVGDAETDLVTGAGAEVTTIGVSWGFRDREVLEYENPTVIVDQPREILTYLNHIG